MKVNKEKFNNPKLSKFMPTIISPISAFHYPNEPQPDETFYRFKRDSLNSKGLNKLPCKLTSRDIKGINESKTTQKKFDKFEEYLRQREEFESNWDNFWEEIKEIEKSKRRRW